MLVLCGLSLFVLVLYLLNALVDATVAGIDRVITASRTRALDLANQWVPRQEERRKPEVAFSVAGRR